LLNIGELVQGFCGRMPFLSPTSRNHSLDLIFSLTTNTPKQGQERHSIYVSSPTPYPRVGWDGLDMLNEKMMTGSNVV